MKLSDYLGLSSSPVLRPGLGGVGSQLSLVQHGWRAFKILILNTVLFKNQLPLFLTPPATLSSLEARLFLFPDSSGHPVFAQGKTRAPQVALHLEQEIVKVVFRFLLIIIFS